MELAPEIMFHWKVEKQLHITVKELRTRKMKLLQPHQDDWMTSQ